MEDVIFPRRLRLIIYIIFSIGSLVMTYLGAKHMIGMDEIVLWTGVAALIGGLAGVNINPPKSH